METTLIIIYILLFIAWAISSYYSIRNAIKEDKKRNL